MSLASVGAALISYVVTAFCFYGLAVTHAAPDPQTEGGTFEWRSLL
ncbi:MAG: hypothetical protein OHK0029_39620 [Armatimonadaceae bacterium]